MYLSNLGTLLADRGDAEGVRVLEMAVAADPGYAVGHYNLARAYLLAGRLELASKTLRYATLLNPRLPEAGQLRTLIDGRVAKPRSE